jgi:hypothetical protein
MQTAGAGIDAYAISSAYVLSQCPLEGIEPGTQAQMVRSQDLLYGGNLGRA